MYQIIEKDPKLLDNINHVKFVHTPLHEAAIAGQTHFAIELMSLMPSFAKKLNPQGLSPLHLAVIEDGNETALALLTLEPELVRVKGREMMTPLHHAVKANNLHLLAHFLCHCPASIDDLTNKCQNAVHIAVQEGKLDALDVLLGWLRKWDREEVLNFEDDNGNTALHIAVETEQIEVLRKLLPKVDKNSFNSNNLTALDIAVGKKNNQLRNILQRKGCRTAKSLGKHKTLPDFLRSKRDKSVLELFVYPFMSIHNDLSLDMRNVTLVVAVLIVTATYQGVLQPPGGFWQGNADSTNNITYNDVELQDQQSQQTPSPGEAVMNKYNFNIFMLGNTAAFVLAILVIFFVFPGRTYLFALYASWAFLTVTYLMAIKIIAQASNPLSPNLFIISSAVIGLAFAARAIVVVPKTPADSGSGSFRLYQFQIKGFQRY